VGFRRFAVQNDHLPIRDREAPDLIEKIDFIHARPLRPG
jgi:hypothetical protein